MSYSGYYQSNIDPRFISNLLICTLCIPFLGNSPLREEAWILMGIAFGKYQYMEDLYGLEGNQACSPVHQFVRGPTPVITSALMLFMHQHPNQQFARYIWNGLCHGFHIGFDRHSHIGHNWCKHSSSLRIPQLSKCISRQSWGEVLLWVLFPRDRQSKCTLAHWAWFLSLIQTNGI